MSLCNNAALQITCPTPPHRATASSQDQPAQHHPQRFCALCALVAQPVFDCANKTLGFPAQLVDDFFGVVEAALALHVLERVALDLFVGRLLLQDVDEDLVAGVGADGVDDWEGEFAFGQVFAQPFERRVARGRGEIEVVVEDLEEQADGGYEGRAVAVDT